MNLFDLISKLCEHSMIPNEPPFSLPDDCIEDFIVFENRPLISCDTKNEILNLSESKVLFSFIQNIQNIFTKRLNHTKSTIYANPSAMKTLFNHMNIFFKLMGWKYVYKAIDISVSDTNVDLRFSTDYSLPHLLDALESYMSKHINKLTMPYYLVAKDKLRECKKRGIEFEARLSLNAEIPYLAEDPAVNLLHCKIFHLPDNKRYFLTENSQEQE